MLWNRTGKRSRTLSQAVRTSNAPRWRLEVYSIHQNAAAALRLSDGVSMSETGAYLGHEGGVDRPPEVSWTKPRAELHVDMMDPFTDEALTTLLGADHRVRFVTGNEAVVDTTSGRLRIRRFRFG